MRDYVGLNSSILDTIHEKMETSAVMENLEDEENEKVDIDDKQLENWGKGENKNGKSGMNASRCFR